MKNESSKGTLIFFVCFLQLLDYYIISAAGMRKQTGGAVLYSTWQYTTVPTAFVAERIERTVAEEAVKILSVFALVARKIFALFI